MLWPLLGSGAGQVKAQATAYRGNLNWGAGEDIRSEMWIVSVVLNVNIEFVLFVSKSLVRPNNTNEQRNKIKKFYSSILLFGMQQPIHLFRLNYLIVILPLLLVFCTFHFNIVMHWQRGEHSMLHFICDNGKGNIIILNVNQLRYLIKINFHDSGSEKIKWKKNIKVESGWIYTVHASTWSGL